MTQFGIYVHWPFCDSKCPYCDFNSHVERKIDHGLWREAYLAEIQRYAGETCQRNLTSIFFGGGTPSLMEPECIADIINAIKTTWAVDKNVEVTIEANPSSSETKNFEAYRSAGVNRLSIGVQSLCDESLLFLGRKHSALEAIDAVKCAAKNFGNFSFDLIYGLPGQTAKRWETELNSALDLCENHLSAYQLTVEPGTEFHRMGVEEADEEKSNQLYDSTQKVMNLAGLPAYEVSNHAKPGSECIHNLLYWYGEDYLGLGPGAHGRLTMKKGNGLLETVAIQEIRNPKKWLDSVRFRRGGTQKRKTLRFEERLEELVLCGLRISEGIDAERFYRVTGRYLFDYLREERLEKLIKGGFLNKTPSNLSLTQSGLRLFNSVIRELLV